MAKYNYDKSVLKGYGVGPFLGEVKNREAHIEAAPASEIQSIYNTNVVAKKLHPQHQLLKIAEVKDYPDAKAYTLVPNEEKGCTELAYFRAGQYLSIMLDIDGATVTKPYTISSSPKSALGEENNSYRILVKKADKGYASKYILKNWKKGTEVISSGPLGKYYYQELRDAKHIVAACGGSGITPFISMAEAVVDGIEDFDITIIYGNKTFDGIAFKDELDELAKSSNGKVKVVHVLSDEKKKGYENGFISADIIRKYAGEGDYSLFVCGNKPFYKFMHGEVEKLGLPIRRARFEVAGEYGDPSQNEKYEGNAKAEYAVKLIIRGEEKQISCKGNQTLLDAIQKAGVRVTSDCRSGECGWCHSRLIRGNVFIPEEADGRREASAKFGWIHPCITYPLSDVELEVFPILIK